MSILAGLDDFSTMKQEKQQERQQEKRDIEERKQRRTELKQQKKSQQICADAAKVEKESGWVAGSEADKVAQQCQSSTADKCCADDTELTEEMKRRAESQKIEWTGRTGQQVCYLLNYNEAQKLGLAVANKTPREICEQLNEQANNECLRQKVTCPEGYATSYKHPRCCRPQKEPATDAKSKFRRAVIKVAAVGRFRNINKVYPVKIMTTEEQRQYLASSALTAEQQKILQDDEPEVTEQSLLATETMLESASEVDKNFMAYFLQQMVNSLSQLLSRFFAYFERIAEQVRTREGLIGKTAATVQWVNDWIVKPGFNLIKYTLEHPRTVMWLTSMANMFKEYLCVRASSYFGYGQVNVKTDLTTAAKAKAKTLGVDTDVVLQEFLAQASKNGIDLAFEIGGAITSSAADIAVEFSKEIPIFGAFFRSAKVVTEKLMSGFRAAALESAKIAAEYALFQMQLQQSGNNLLALLDPSNCLAPAKIFEIDWDNPLRPHETVVSL